MRMLITVVVVAAVAAVGAPQTLPLLPHNIETPATVSALTPARYALAYSAAHTWFCVAAAADRGPNNAELSLYWAQTDPGNDYAALAVESAVGPSVMVCGQGAGSPPRAYLALEARVIDGINPSRDVSVSLRSFSGVGPRPLLASATVYTQSAGSTASGLAFGAAIPGQLAFAPASDESLVASYLVFSGPLFRTHLFPSGPISATAAEIRGTPGAPDLDMWHATNSAAELMAYASNFSVQSITPFCSSVPTCRYTVPLTLLARTAGVAAVVAVPGPSAPPGAAAFSMGTTITSSCTTLSAASTHGECRPVVRPSPPASRDEDGATASAVWIWFLVFVALAVVVAISALIARSMWRNRKKRRANAGADADGADGKPHADLLGESAGRRKLYADFDTAPDWLWKKTDYDLHMYAMGADGADGAPPTLRVGPYEADDGKKAQDRADRARRKEQAAAAPPAASSTTVSASSATSSTLSSNSSYSYSYSSS